MYTVQNAKDDLTGVIHGGSLSKIKNINSLFRRAARKVGMKIDSRETERFQEVEIFDGIYDYILNEDIKKIFDIRPQANRQITDNLQREMFERFDHLKPDNTFHIKFNDATKSLRISKILPNSVFLDNCNTIGSGSNAWTAGDDSTNITLDNVTFTQGGSSINFDVDGSTTTASISRTLPSAIDLSEHDEQSTLFYDAYFPNASAITSVELRWGNSDSVYWSQTNSSPFDRSAYRDGWNILDFAWNGATETGTVDPENIDYINIIITYDGTADTDFRIDNITSKLGQKWEVWYYSTFLFRSSSGTYSNTTSSDEDIINVDVDGEEIFLQELLFAAAQQMQGEDAQADLAHAREELHGAQGKPGLYAEYKKSHPSNEMRSRTVYYRMQK